MSVTRRELRALLPAELAPSVLLPQSFQRAPAPMKAMCCLLRCFRLRSSLRGHRTPPQFATVLKGKLATGESVEVHETTLSPGGTPHPPYRHLHSEMWLIREGTIELTVEGRSAQMGPGSVGFVHSNEEHGIKNIGAQPLTYCVVAIGPGSVERPAALVLVESADIGRMVG